MPRDHARVNVTIWGDPDYRLLPPAAQHLYLALWTSPQLTYCGTHDWRPARMNGLWSGFTVEDTMTTAACLQARHFLVIDDDTEEVLIRAWARFDGLMKQPRMAVSLVNVYASLKSRDIRSVVVNELHKIREEGPDLACWKDSRVAEILTHPRVSAKELEVPQDPFDPQFAHGFRQSLALGLPQTRDGVYPSVCTPPTPAPAPAPLLQRPREVEETVTGDAGKPAKRRAHQLPDDYAPKDAHSSLAADLGLDLDDEVDRFRDYWLGEGKPKADWDATLRNWLRNSAKRASAAPREEPRSRLPEVHELEEPPDGLTEAEYSAWSRQQVAKRQAAR